MLIRFTAKNTDKTTDFVISSYKRNEVYYNNLKPVENTINATIPYTEELATFFKTNSADYIKAKLIDNNTVIYNGYLRKTFTFVKTQRNQPIAIQLVSPSFMLDKELELNQTEVFESKSFLYIINKLLQKAGFYSTDKTAAFFSSDLSVQASLNSVCSIAVVRENENIKTLLEQICFEIGTIFDFDSNADFKLFPIFNAPGNVTQKFNDRNVLDQITLQKKEEECNNVILKWKLKEYKENTLIFSDTQNGDNSNKCKIEIKPNEYLFGEQTNYFNYDSEYGTIISVDSITTKDIEGTVDLLSFKNAILNIKTAAEVSYRNTTAQNQTVTKLDIYGNAWIENEGENLTKATTGTKTKDFQIRFLNSSSKIKALAQDLVSYYRYSDFTVDLKSKENFAIGSFVEVDCEGIAKITARVISKKTYIGKPFEYTLEAVSEYETPTVNTQVYKGSSGTSTENVIRDKIDSVSSELQEILTPVKIELYKRSSTDVSATGISGNALFNFKTNTLSWDAAATSNGWTTEIPAGTDPLYITVASVSGKGEAFVVPSTAWAKPVLFVKNGEDGVNATESYTIIPNYNIVTRYQDGTLSSNSIKFSFYKANNSDRGQITVFYRISASSVNGIWNEVKTGSGINAEIEVGNFYGIKCDIYLDNQATIPLDSETIGIIQEGSGAVFVGLSNSNVSVSADAEGVVSDYSQTQTFVYVVCGANNLNYGDPTKRGYFSVSVLLENVIERQSREIAFEGKYVNETGSVYIDQDGNEYLGVGYFELPPIVDMVADTGSRTITVRGTSYDGNTFEQVAVQTIIKVKDGIPGGSVTLLKIEYAVSDSVETVPENWTEERPTEISQGFYLWTKKVFHDESKHTDYAEYSYNYQGVNGTNSTTVVIYQRAASIPDKPTASFTYFFENPPRYEWGTAGSSKGWLFDKPAVSLSKLPLYEIRATALSGTGSDVIEATEWSNPIITQMDNGLTREETEAVALAVAGQVSEETKKQIIQSLTPVFTVDTNDAIFAVNENHIVPISQKKIIKISCKQNGNDFPFTFEKINVPNTVKYSVDGNTIVLTVNAGTMLQNGTVTITVKTSPYEALMYGDQNNNLYIGENLEEYGILDFDDTENTIQVLHANFTTITGGEYYKAKSYISEIPSDAIIGDFFTWAGEKTESNLVISGYFEPAKVYTWNGSYWIEENNIKHLPITLGDVLSIADADLEKNNSDAYVYVDHVTSNSVFAKLVVAKLVDADLILSKEAISNKFIAIGEDIEDVDVYAKSLSKDISDVDVYAKKLNELLSDSPDETIIEGGKINTNLLKVDLIISKYIDEGGKIPQNNITGLIDALGNKLEDSDIADDIKDYHVIYTQIDLKDTNIPNPPTSYITASTTTWKLTKPAYNADKVVYSCFQYLQYDNSVKNSPVTIDYETIFDVKNGYLRLKVIDTTEIRSGLATVTQFNGLSATIDDIKTGTLTVGKAASATNATNAANAANATDATNAKNVASGSISGMTTGGASATSIVLHTSDWTSALSKTGFGILKNGDSYFNNINIRGSSTVEGSILCNHGLLSSKVNAITGGSIQNLLSILDDVIDGNQYKETYKYLFQGSLTIQDLDTSRNNIFRCHTNFISRTTYPTEKNYFIMCEDSECYDVSLYVHLYTNGTYLLSFTRQETGYNWEWTNVRINRFRGIL